VSEIYPGVYYVWLYFGGAIFVQCDKGVSELLAVTYSYSVIVTLELEVSVHDKT
jgi:hypothetical protein